MSSSDSQDAPKFLPEINENLDAADAATSPHDVAESPREQRYYDSNASEAQQEQSSAHETEGEESANSVEKESSESSANDDIQPHVQAQGIKQEPQDELHAAMDRILPKKKKRKRSKVLTSDTDSEAQSEEEEEEEKQGSDDSEARAAAAAEKKRKKKEKKKQKKEKRRLKKLKKKAEQQEKEEEDDDQGGSVSDDDEKDNLIDEVQELLADAERQQITYDAAREAEARAAKAQEKRDAAAAAEEGDAAAAAELFEWPKNDDEFEILYRPINVIDDRALGAVLVYTVQMNEEALRERLMQAAGEARKDIVRDYLQAMQDTWHACNSCSFFDNLSQDCGNGSAFQETDVCEWRRSAEIRQSGTLRKQWVLVTLEQSNRMALARDYSCSIGAYRLRVKGRYNELFGVYGGDFAAAAVPTVHDTRKYTAIQLKSIERFNALCLTKKEMGQVVLDVAKLQKFANRNTTDAQRGISDARINCLGFLPMSASKAICLDVQGLTCNSRRSICERLPVMSAVQSLKILRAPRSETSAPVNGEFMQMRPTYNVNVAVNLMHGVYFDMAYFHNNSEGQTNVHLYNGWLDQEQQRGGEQNNVEVGTGSARFAASVNSPNKGAEDSTRQELPAHLVNDFVRCKALGETGEVHNLCLIENSGKAYRTRTRDALKRVVRSVSGSNEAQLDGELVRKAWRKLVTLQTRWNDAEHVHLLQEQREHSSLMAFLRFFGDAFVDEDEAFSVSAKAFGLRNARDLMYDKSTGTVFTLLQQSQVPHVIFFNSSLRDYRHKLANCVHYTFLPWLRTSRPEAHALLLQRTGIDEEKLGHIIKHVMQGVNALDTVRSTDERSVVLASGLSEQDVQAYKAVVNVNDSHVRVVSVSNKQEYVHQHCLFLLENNDYFVEDALRTLLLNMATISNALHEDEADDFARLVLLRGSNGDDAWELMFKEMREVHDKGGRCLIVVRDQADEHAFDDLCMNAGFTNYGVVRLQNLEAGPLDVNKEFYSEMYARVFFFNAHRFSYDALLYCVVLLAGFKHVPPMPLAMNNSQRGEWERQYEAACGEAPTERVVQSRYDQKRDAFGAFAQKVSDGSVYEKLCESDERVLWPASTFAFVFAFVAYARPDALKEERNQGTGARSFERDMELSPHGNPFEDMYFGCVNNSGAETYWRIEELYSYNLAQQLQVAKQDGSLMYLPAQSNVNDISQHASIKETLKAAYRQGMQQRAPQEIAKEKQQFAQAQQQAARQARRDRQTQLNFPNEGRYGECCITVPQWIDTRQRVAPYVPEAWDRLTREVVPREMHMKATRFTYTVATQEREVRRVRMTALICGDPPLRHRNFHRGDAWNTGHVYATDICGFGRTTVTELINRLRFRWTLFLVVADTEENFLRQCLMPNVKRTSVNSDTHARMPELRACGLIAQEAQYCPESIRNQPNYQHSYYSCLQSSCAFAWQDATDATVAFLHGGGGGEQEEEEEQQLMDVDDE